MTVGGAGARVEITEWPPTPRSPHPSPPAAPRPGSGIAHPADQAVVQQVEEDLLHPGRCQRQIVQEERAPVRALEQVATIVARCGVTGDDGLPRASRAEDQQRVAHSRAPGAVGGHLLDGARSAEHQPQLLSLASVLIRGRQRGWRENMRLAGESGRVGARTRRSPPSSIVAGESLSLRAPAFGEKVNASRLFPRFLKCTSPAAGRVTAEGGSRLNDS